MANLIQEHAPRRRRSNLPVKLFQNSRGVWFASFTDQKGKRRFISLKTKDGKVAEQIAQQIVPHELARTREPIHKEVVRYLEEKAELRSPNWTWDGGCVLRTWADANLSRNGNAFEFHSIRF